jgi:hypothetical protein
MRRNPRGTFGADVGQRIRRDQTVRLQPREVGDETRIETPPAELDAERLDGRPDATEGHSTEERASGRGIRARQIGRQPGEDRPGTDRRGESVEELTAGGNH